MCVSALIIWHGVQCQQRPEEGLQCPGPRLTGYRGTTQFGFWELNLCPLKEEQDLLKTEPPFQSLIHSWTQSHSKESTWPSNICLWSQHSAGGGGNQRFKVIFGYTGNLRPIRAMWDPVSIPSSTDSNDNKRAYTALFIWEIECIPALPQKSIPLNITRTFHYFQNNLPNHSI